MLRLLFQLLLSLHLQTLLRPIPVCGYCCCCRPFVVACFVQPMAGGPWLNREMLPTKSTRQLQVLHKYRLAFCVHCTVVGVLEQSYEVCLACSLQREDGVGLEAILCADSLERYFFDEALKR